jgi:MraZ protein
MESEKTNGPTYITGTFTHTVDEKRRLSVPAKWREFGTELALILWPKEKVGWCIRVLPPKKWADLVQQIENMPSDDPNKTFLTRFIGRRAVQVSVDNAGRICLPPDMAERAGIKDKAVLLGMFNKYEIWNPALAEALEQGEEFQAQTAFTKLD